jgi:hypothetical protein
MSTIRTNTLLAADGSTTTEPSIPALDQRMAKAWVTANGQNAPASILDSYNISSVTDRGVGLYTFNYASSFSNTDYCFVASTMDGGGENDDAGVGCSSGGKTTTGLALFTYHNDGSVALNDADNVHVIVFSN